MGHFKDMSSADQQALAQKIMDCLKEHDLGDTEVTVYREMVCQLTSDKVEEAFRMSVEKSLPSSMEEKATKFNEAVKPLVEGIEGIKIAVNSELGAGDMYKTIENVETLESSDPVKIEHKQGEVLLIDFWATWCPPCQAPMAHNEQMLKDHGAEWGDKVRIIGLSIDGEKEKLINHINAKDWKKPEHYFRGKSNASDVYQVRGVPHVMLIDVNGKIAFKGHPANRPDLAKDLTAMMNGEAITGKGCAPEEKPAGADGDKPEARCPDGWKEGVNPEDIHKEIDGHKPTLEQMQKDLKEDATGMMRNFCVLVFQLKMIPNTGAKYTKYENYRVLVGSQEKIDKCNNAIKEKISGTFEINEQLHPM